MLIKVGERRVTTTIVDFINEEAGRRLTLFLFALATGRPGYSDEADSANDTESIFKAEAE